MRVNMNVALTTAVGIVIGTALYHFVVVPQLNKAFGR